LTRASTPFLEAKNVDGRVKPGHDEEGMDAMPLGAPHAHLVSMIP
jgi:hypothetical protein